MGVRETQMHRNKSQIPQNLVQHNSVNIVLQERSRQVAERGLEISRQRAHCKFKALLPLQFANLFNELCKMSCRILLLAIRNKWNAGGTNNPLAIRRCNEHGVMAS